MSRETTAEMKIPWDYVHILIGLSALTLSAELRDTEMSDLSGYISEYSTG